MVVADDASGKAREPALTSEQLQTVAEVSDDVVLYHLLRAVSRELREAALTRLVEVEGAASGPPPEGVLDDDEAWLAWHETVLGTAFRRR